MMYSYFNKIRGILPASESSAIGKEVMSSWNRTYKAFGGEAATDAAINARRSLYNSAFPKELQSWFESLPTRYSISLLDSNIFKTIPNRVLSETIVAARYAVAPGNRSLFNVANLASVFGVVANHWGSVNIDNIKGVIGIGIGRSTDIIDGKLARALQQESEIGKTLDHSMDKIAMADILYHAWKKNIGPKPILAAIGLLNASNSIITVATKVLYPEKELAPTKSGKFSIALQGVTVGAFMIEKQTEQRYRKTATAFRFVGYLATGACLTLGVHSTIQYAKRLIEEG